MAKNRSELERAAGKLIAAIQKEWHEQLGEPSSVVSESVMNQAHGLLAAAKSQSVSAVLGGQSVSSFLGTLWVKSHPSVLPAIRAFEASLTESANA